MRTLFDLCVPRADVKAGGIRESEFAADLARVLRGEGAAEYLDAPSMIWRTTGCTWSGWLSKKGRIAASRSATHGPS